MYGLHSVTPASNDSSDVLERRSSNSLLGRLQKMHQPWSEIVKEEGGLINLAEEEEKTLSNSGMNYMSASTLICICNFVFTLDAAKHVLSVLGCSALSSNIKSEESGRDLEGQSVAAVGVDVEPEDVLWLKVLTRNTFII